MLRGQQVELPQHLSWHHLLVCGPLLWILEFGITAVANPGTIDYKMNIVLYWRRLDTLDSDHELIRKLFTEVINQARSRLISHKLTYNQVFSATSCYMGTSNC